MKYSCFFIFTLVAFTLCSQTLNIQVSGVRKPTGTIRLAFYTNSEAFDKEQPLFIKTVAKTDMKDGVLKMTYKGLKEGVYGIAVLDDENNNQKMDYGLALPKEGFGFSDYYHKGMTRPKFDSFKFELTKETRNIQIKVRYL